MEQTLHLLVTYTCRPDMREAFLRRIAREGTQAAVKAEEGCLHYDYFLPLADDGLTLLLHEEWTGPEALERHLAAPHMQAFAAFKGDYVAETKLLRLRES